MLLSSSNRKYPPFPLLSYFSVAVCLRCLLHQILLLAYTFRENREFVNIIFVQFMMSASSRIRFDLRIVFIYLYSTPSHYHHCVNLSEIRQILSVINYTLRGAVCFQFTHFPCDDWDNIYTLSYHHQIGSMKYYPLFRVRSWNNGVRCMSFCILTDIFLVIFFHKHKINRCRWELGYTSMQRYREVSVWHHNGHVCDHIFI